jgi:PleD family two-component response regulator
MELIDEEAIEHEASEVADVITVSQGLVTVAPKGELEPAELIERADGACTRPREQGATGW